MAELQPTSLRNTDQPSLPTGDYDSTIRQVLVDVEHLMDMLSNELDQNKKSSTLTNCLDISPQQLHHSKNAASFCCPISSSTTITDVTVTEENHRLIEHLQHRILRLEHERNVLLTSYQLLIKLLK